MTDYSTKIAALEEALASGELTVESDGERVTYRSIADLKAAIDYFVSRNAPSVGSISRPASTVAIYDPR
ncbi:hypothetical protein LL253_17600 [Sphingobium soli]|uniref:Phage tail protein n=1 Tax=Sphingobium soli TaxID=1591116 RepID=A0ABS8H7G9_9SPHN|nr:hypothetical protein [Sphingobium soli]MCC4234490.1 hypothetical protein [Sphingobium soli]